MKKRKTPFYETFTLNGRPMEPDYESEGPQDMVLRVLKHAPHPLRLDDILRIGSISRRFKRDVLLALQALADDGKLMRLSGGAWVSAESLKTVQGVLAMQRSGAAFLVPKAGEKPFPKGDIFIDPDSVGQAWNGDLVEVVLLPGQHGPSPEGRVLRVLEHGQSELTVRVVRPERKSESGEPRRVLCRPADPRLNFDMLVDVTEMLAAGGDLQRDELLRVAVGQLLPSPVDNPLWSGKALRSLGLEDDVTVQEQLVKLNHMIPTTFPDDVLAEAQSVAAGESEALAEKIEDVRSIPLVTIDGADARDFDDAVFVEAGAKGWRLLVAIADVSYYVRPRSRLDKEALARGNSYYFPTSVEPMLPEALSNGVCSLRPNEDRRVMVADMQLDASGVVRESRFYNAVMRSHARLTYEQAQAMLDGTPSPEMTANSSVTAMLTEAGKLADVLIQRRAKRGGLDFDIPEAEFTTTDGRVTGVRHRQRLFSHRLIEAFMVCANEAVAEFLSKKDAPLLFRVHPEPGPEKMETLVRSLRAVSLPLPLPAMSVVTGKAPSYKKAQDRPRRKPDSQSTATNPGKSISQWLPAVLQAAADTPQSYIVGRLALRSMMQARYTPEKEIHFGLASEAYSHFTSPIRRYADLVTHRALKYALGLDIGGAIPTGQKLFEVAEHCNTHEKTAQDAEREIARRLGCLLLQNRVGEEFHGIISGVTNFGLFVELDGLPIEGMIKVETLGNDYYEYNPDRQELRGKSTGEAWRLGQALDVRLVEVNVGRLEVTLALADDPDNPRSERPAFRRNARPQGARSRSGGRDAKYDAPRKDGRRDSNRGKSRGSRSR